MSRQAGTSEIAQYYFVISLNLILVTQSGICWEKGKAQVVDFWNRWSGHATMDIFNVSDKSDIYYQVPKVKVK